MFFFKKKHKNMQAEATAPKSDSPITLIASSHSPAPATGKSSVSYCASVVSDVGCVRGNNEDNYILDRHMNASSANYSEISVSTSDPTDQWHFAGVFDGMGGGEKGEVASLKTAQIFLEAVAHLKESSTKANVDLMLRNAFLEANNAIVALQENCNIFGTTGTVLCTNGEECKLYHLGDSRAYLIRDGRLFQLTQDQTLAQMKIDAGLYDASAPQAEADKHKLTEYIGRDRTKEHLRPVESEWIRIRKGDRVLLCSDGLYDMCSDLEIEQILQKYPKLDMQVKKLTEAARNKGGVDNITCIIVAFS